MQTAEAWRQRCLLFRELNGDAAREHVFAGEGHAFEQLDQEEARQKVAQRERSGMCSRCHGVVPALVPDIPRCLNPNTHHQQPDQGEWNEDLPTQTHDLVIAITWERGTHPQEHGHDHKGLDAKPNPARDHVEQCVVEG